MRFVSFVLEDTDGEKWQGGFVVPLAGPSPSRTSSCLL